MQAVFKNEGGLVMRRVLMSIVLTLCTACPETWGKGGIVDKAMEKDTQDAMRKRRRPQDCPMSDEKWVELCDSSDGQDDSSQCSYKCIPPK